ncbi:MAG: response regulator [Bacteroidetes bacterium]|nr:response regulator [Bacteroidota bacterium]
MIDSTLKNSSILIVDDKKSNIEILEGLLEESGYKHFISTTDPRQVVSLFKSFAPDLILLDLMMPYFSGFEVMDELNSMIPANTYLPILVLTADITPEARQKALSGGAKDFLSKPYDLYEVRLRIKNLLETRYLYQQLKSSNKELEAFSYSVSHDLRAPLRHISSFIDMLKEMNRPDRSEQELRYMDIISNGAAEMSKLIEALLSFSRLNHTELRKTPIHSTVMVNEVVKSLEPEMQNRNVIFKIGQLFDCEGDVQLIRQVWINLISNAIKYTGKRAEAIIEIGSIHQDMQITYFVKDNGAGFDMKYAGKLFTVFKRLHKASDYDGIGIGLATVNSIITRHGGSCSAEGEVGKGAAFFFSLPYTKYR